MSFAQQLGENAAALKHAPKVVVEDLFDFNQNAVPHDGALVVVVSCFGKGEPPDSAKVFYKWLMDPVRTSEELFKGMPFAVFGCGSSKVGAVVYVPLDVHATEFHHRRIRPSTMSSERRLIIA